MNNNRPVEPPPSISLGDIYFVVFRHKWKILVMSLLGLAVAAAFASAARPCRVLARRPLQAASLAGRRARRRVEIALD